MEYLILILLLSLSAFFSGSETAIFHLHKASIEKISSYSPSFHILRKREKLLPTILLGNTLVNAGASIIAAKIFYSFFNTPYGVAIITGIMTYIILVSGEFLPKLYSLRNAEKVAKFSIPILNIFRFLLFPITRPINALMELIIPKPELPPQLITREEIKVLTECEAQDGHITEIEKNFILGLLEFKSKRVEEIMTSTNKIYALPIETELDNEIIKRIRHSRIPIYKKDINNIVGILYMKDLLAQGKAVTDPKSSYSIKKLIRKPHIVCTEMRASELLSYFQKNRVHIAIVKDKKKTKGIVTLDDILNTIIH